MMPLSRRLVAGLVTILACGLSNAGKAETRLNATYTISMTGVSIGHLSWTVDVNAAPQGGVYRASASGKASGALSILVNGEGTAAVQGALTQAAESGGNWRATPSFFSAHVVDDGVATGLRMTFENASVTNLRYDAPPPNDGRIPLRDEDLRGVSDPLSAMLIAAPGGGNPLAAESCDRTLAIFDGQRRYDLVLSFKRVDKIKIERGYNGLTLVCGVALRPITGHRADSLLVKYVSGRRDMEIWFVPLAGTPLAAPARLKMPTVVGTLEIAANRFETVMAASMPPAPKP